MIVFTPEEHVAASRCVFAASRISTAVRDFDGWCRTAKSRHGERVLICSGKIGHELRAERKQRSDTITAILFLDQLYPFPEEELRAEMARHPNAREIVWVQEEPANMGALSYVLPRLRTYFRETFACAAVKRSAERESRDGLGQGARAGTENFADAGVQHRPILKSRPRTAAAAPGWLLDMWHSHRAKVFAMAGQSEPPQVA